MAAPPKNKAKYKEGIEKPKKTRKPNHPPFEKGNPGGPGRPPIPMRAYKKNLKHAYIYEDIALLRKVLHEGLAGDDKSVKAHALNMMQSLLSKIPNMEKTLNEVVTIDWGDDIKSLSTLAEINAFEEKIVLAGIKDTSILPVVERFQTILKNKRESLRDSIAESMIEKGE